MPEAPTAPAPVAAAPTPSAPTQSAPQAPPPSNGMDLMAGIKGAVEAKNNPQPAAKPAQKAAQPQAKTGEQKAKVEGDKPAEPANPWDAEAVALEETKEEAQVEETPPEELKTPETKTKWKELKDKATELDKILPEYTALKDKIAKLEATPNKLAPEVESELNDLRQFKAAYAIEDTPEFHESVRQPYAKQEALISEVADYAGVDFEALLKATDEPNTLKRVQAIKKVLSASEIELDEQAVSIVANAANVMHESIYPKQAELRAKALEIQNAFKGKQELQTSHQKAEQETRLKESTNQMFTTLEAKLKPTGLFDNAELATKLREAKLENPAEAPLKAAYQAQAAVLLPAFITKYNELMGQLKEAKSALKARGGSSAGPTDTSPIAKSTTNDYDGGTSLEDQIRQATGFRR